ncbi:uncharacterized protein LOC132556596 [Ylistrum balloti]|uniref:uncharacterized protein LOC132556596 n=1 Tax=Ylistrum balloti TaxID=509963 RepID=UPI002905B528|nr:uncharacterized protein LOC132556596 [Ylistrum balloti]
MSTGSRAGEKQANLRERKPKKDEAKQNVPSEDYLGQEGPDNDTVQKRIMSFTPVQYGLGIITMLVLVMGSTVYTLHARNGELVSRIEKLERKILIDQDIEKLQSVVKKLEGSSSELETKVKTMDNTVKKLEPKVNELDETFDKLKPTAAACKETIDKLEPKLVTLDQTADKMEPKVETIKEKVSKMEPKVDEMDAKVTKLEPVVKQMDGKFQILEPKVDKSSKLVEGMEPKIKILDETVKSLQPKVKMIDDKVGEMEPKMEHLDDIVIKLEPTVEEMSGAVKEMEPTIKMLDLTFNRLKQEIEKSDGIMTELKPKIETIKETFDRLEPKVDRTDKTVQKLEPVIQDMDRKVDKLKPTVGGLDESVKSMEERIETLNTKVSDTETLTGDVRDLKNITEEMHERLSNLGNYSWKKLPESHLRLDHLELSSSSHFKFLCVLLVMSLCLVCWSVYSYSQISGMKNVQYRPTSAAVNQRIAQTPTTDRESYRPVQSVLDSMHPSSLANQICVISFYPETMALHMRLVESACRNGELAKVARVSFFLSNHNSIPKLPRVKVFLVFVDFNERDIILEHPQREVGDLRLTTVQGARKLGGDVFVVYVKDKGSQNLDGGQLYNKRLRSIETHPELSDLSAKQRVLTTFDGFTVHQCSHLAKCFLRTLQK